MKESLKNLGTFSFQQLFAMSHKVDQHAEPLHSSMPFTASIWLITLMLIACFYVLKQDMLSISTVIFTSLFLSLFHSAGSSTMWKPLRQVNHFQWHADPTVNSVCPSRASKLLDSRTKEISFRKARLHPCCKCSVGLQWKTALEGKKFKQNWIHWKQWLSIKTQVSLLRKSMSETALNQPVFVNVSEHSQNWKLFRDQNTFHKMLWECAFFSFKFCSFASPLMTNHKVPTMKHHLKMRVCLALSLPSRWHSWLSGSKSKHHCSRCQSWHSSSKINSLLLQKDLSSELSSSECVIFSWILSISTTFVAKNMF